MLDRAASSRPASIRTWCKRPACMPGCTGRRLALRERSGDGVAPELIRAEAQRHAREKRRAHGQLDAISLQYDSFGRLVLTDANGRRHVGVEPIRSFPLSDGSRGFRSSTPRGSRCCGSRICRLAASRAEIDRRRASPPRIHARRSSGSSASRQIPIPRNGKSRPTGGGPSFC